MEFVHDYSVGILICAVCLHPHHLRIRLKPEGGFQIQIPEEWELRQWELGRPDLWAICGDCRKREPVEVPTCISCAKPLSGHARTCPTLGGA